MLMPTEENIRIYHELLAAYSTMQHSLAQSQTIGKSYKPPCSSGSKTVSGACSASAQQMSAKTAYQQGKSALFEGPSFHPRNSSVNVHRNNPVNSHRLTSQSVKNEYTDRKETSAHVAKYEYMKRNGIATHAPQIENMERKRKISDCQGVLDLSMKKPKVETAVTPALATVSPRYACLAGPQDSPLDFSMKKPTHTNSVNPTCTNSVRPTSTYSVKPLNTVHKPQNLVSPVHRMNSGAVSQFRNSVSSSQLLNKVSVQTAKSSNPTNSQNKNGAYNSLWNCVRRQLDKDMSKWSVEQVCLFLGCLDGCGDYMQVNL